MTLVAAVDVIPVAAYGHHSLGDLQRRVRTARDDTMRMSLELWPIRNEARWIARVKLKLYCYATEIKGSEAASASSHP